MFCPNCGQADQNPDTYCRQCGKYLNDPESRGSTRQQTPQDQFNVSIAFNLLTAIFSIAMAIALIVVHAGEEDIHGVIYAVIVSFGVIAAWQVVSVINNFKLKNRFKNSSETEVDAARLTTDLKTKELPEADLENIVPASVTEKTTRDLSGVKRSTKAEQ